MLQKILTKRDEAVLRHRCLPDEIRRYLNKGRGIPDGTIDHFLLGWDGKRITIPIFDRGGEVTSFRLAKSPHDKSNAPKMLTSRGGKVDLYGWDTLAREPRRVVICEGEFDRLVLESRGFPAVTSTGGANAFLEEWAAYFANIRHVFICFDRDAAGKSGANRVRSLLPKARIVRLPTEVGEKGDVTDYFVRLGKTRIDFEILLATAAAEDDDVSGARDGYNPSPKRPPPHKTVMRRADRVKKAISLADIVGKYATLRPSGANLVGGCPFHTDSSPSFTVYPETNTYYCFGCKAHGDLISFLKHKESITFGQALERLELFLYTHELKQSA